MGRGVRYVNSSHSRIVIHTTGYSPNSLRGAVSFTQAEQTLFVAFLSGHRARFEALLLASSIGPTVTVVDLQLWLTASRSDLSGEASNSYFSPSVP